MGNVIVPVGIRHSVVQIAVESTVMHPVVRVTVKKELRPISPYLKGCDTLSGFSVLHAVWRVILSSIIQFSLSSFPWAIRKGNAKVPAGNRHRVGQSAAESTATHPVARVTPKKGIPVTAVIEPLTVTIVCAG